MGEVIRLDEAARSFPAPQTRPTQQMPYKIYLAYQQAEAVFRALYFGRPLDLETMTSRPSAKIVEQHWPAVERLAATLLREGSLTRRPTCLDLFRAQPDPRYAPGDYLSMVTPPSAGGLMHGHCPHQMLRWVQGFHPVRF